MPRPYTGKEAVGRCEVKRPNGSIYVYERTSWYDREAKKTRSKRRLLGIKDPETGELKNTRQKKKRSLARAGESGTANRKDNAMIRILSRLSDESGVTKEIAARDWGNWAIREKILTLVWATLASESGSQCGTENWTRTFQRELPYREEPLSRDMCRELYREIGNRTDLRWDVFRQRARETEKEERLVFEFPTDIRTGTVHAAEKIVCLCSSGTGRVIACDRTAGPSLEPLLTHLSPRTFGLDTEVVQSREYVSDEEIGEYLRAKRPFIVRIEPDRKWISAEVEKFRGDGCLFGDPFGNGKRITVDHAFPVRRGKDSTIYGGDRIEARLNVFLCTSTSQRGEEDRDFLIRFEQAREDALNGCYLDGETRAFLERYCKMSRDADGTITEVSLTEAGREKRKNHGIMVLVANREDDIETALRKCRLGNEIAEDFEPKSPFEEDCRMPDTGAECPDGELFVRFLAGCMRECLRVRLRRMETFLGITNGNGEHDLQQNLEAETKVKNWLRKQSVSSLLAHFEDLKIETLSNGRLCMPDDSDPTDALFLKAFLGVEESQE